MCCVDSEHKYSVTRLKVLAGSTTQQGGDRLVYTDCCTYRRIEGYVYICVARDTTCVPAYESEKRMRPSLNEVPFWLMIHMMNHQQARPLLQFVYTCTALHPCRVPSWREGPEKQETVTSSLLGACNRRVIREAARSPAQALSTSIHTNTNKSLTKARK